MANKAANLDGTFEPGLNRALRKSWLLVCSWYYHKNIHHVSKKSYFTNAEMQEQTRATSSRPPKNRSLKLNPDVNHSLKLGKGLPSGRGDLETRCQH